MSEAAPAKIRRKPKAAEEANPWANLNQDDAKLINEDTLMKDSSEQVATKKFCGDKDIM